MALIHGMYHIILGWKQSVDHPIFLICFTTQSNVKALWCILLQMFKKTPDHFCAWFVYLNESVIHDCNIIQIVL